MDDEDEMLKFHDNTMRQLGSRLSVAAGALHRAARDGQTKDHHGVLLIANRLEQIAFGIAARSDGGMIQHFHTEPPHEAKTSSLLNLVR